MNQNGKTPAIRLLMLSLFAALLAGGVAAAEEITLDEAVAEALMNNPQMAQAEAVRNAAAAGTDETRADYFPKASAAYSYQRFAEDPYVVLAGRKAVINSTQQQHWEVSLSQPLFTGFAITARHQIAQLGLETRELEARQTELALAQQVKHAYFGLLMAMKVHEVAQASETNLAAHEDDAKRFHEQGLIPLNDLLKAQVARAEAVQELARATARVRSAKSTLNVVLGRDYDADTRVADVAEATPEGIASLDALVAEALSNRPDISVLERAAAARSEEIRLAQSDYYPRLDLTGKYQQDGDDFMARTNDYGNQYNASIAVQARWVFFEAGKTRARVARARSEQRAIEKALERLKDGARLQVQQAWLDLDVADRNIITMRTALGQAREHWRITNLRFRQQLTTSTEVLDARTYLSRAETGFYQALYGSGVARADLDEAVGKR
ncbi:MAG: TolC family protein [Pseudomonadota bacterium]